MVSNHHLGTLLGLLLAALEMSVFKDQYQPQVIRNAKAFARALHNQGLAVEGDPEVDFPVMSCCRALAVFDGL